jgi:hypothetical protein
MLAWGCQTSFLLVSYLFHTVSIRLPRCIHTVCTRYPYCIPTVSVLLAYSIPKAQIKVEVRYRGLWMKDRFNGIVAAKRGSFGKIVET